MGQCNTMECGLNLDYPCAGKASTADLSLWHTTEHNCPLSGCIRTLSMFTVDTRMEWNGKI